MEKITNSITKDGQSMIEPLVHNGVMLPDPLYGDKRFSQLPKEGPVEYEPILMPTRDDLNLFWLYLQRNGRKESTIKVHLFTIKKLLRTVKPLTLENFMRFLIKEKDRGCKNSYLNHFICTMHAWGKFNNRPEFLKIPFLKEAEFIKATMSDEEIEAFLALPPVVRHFVHHKTGTEYSSFCDVKGHNVWTLFYSIMAYTGMRPGEVAHLKVQDVDFGRNIFILTDTKVNRSRNVPIPPNLVAAINKHIKELDGEYLFPSRRFGKVKGPVVDNVDWHYNFHKRLNRLGIKRPNISPYSLRHSYITRLLEEDVALFKVQKMVGHSQVNTTSHYTHLTTKDLQETVKKHPLVRKGTSPHHILKSLAHLIRQFGLDDDRRFYYNIQEENDLLKVEIKVTKPDEE